MMTHVHARRSSTSPSAAAHTIVRTSSAPRRAPSPTSSCADASRRRDAVSSRGSIGSACVLGDGSHGDVRVDDRARGLPGTRVLLRLCRGSSSRRGRPRSLVELADAEARPPSGEEGRIQAPCDRPRRSSQSMPPVRASSGDARRGAGRLPCDSRRPKDISARGVRVRGLLSSQPTRYVARALTFDAVNYVSLRLHCWNPGPRDPRDGMFTFCQLERGHAGQCKFERDHLGSGSQPWHPCQTEPVETREDVPRVCPVTNRLEERT